MPCTLTAVLPSRIWPSDSLFLFVSSNLFPFCYFSHSVFMFSTLSFLQPLYNFCLVSFWTYSHFHFANECRSVHARLQLSPDKRLFLSIAASLSWIQHVNGTVKPALVKHVYSYRIMTPSVQFNGEESLPTIWTFSFLLHKRIRWYLVLDHHPC